MFFKEKDQKFITEKFEYLHKTKFLKENKNGILISRTVAQNLVAMEIFYIFNCLAEHYFSGNIFEIYSFPNKSSFSFKSSKLEIFISITENKENLKNSSL